MNNRFRRFFLSLVCVFAAASALAQPVNPVSWKTSYSHLSDDLYQVELTATIGAGYHMYDFGPYEVGGPNATVITFKGGEGYELVDSVVMVSTPVKTYDDIYEMNIGYFEGKAEFTQKIRLHAKSAKVTLNVEWMSCNDNACVPPEDADLTVEVKSEGKGTWSKAAAAPKNSDGGTIEAPKDANAAAAGNSIWALILEAIAWGFAALLTPCVFPMVPMTVSFFIKGSGDQKTGKFRALMYGLFIVLLYTLPIAIIIMLTRIIGGEAVTADIFNWLATNWIPNLLFFIVFLVFAASFFGAFEITMPEKMVNGSDSKSNKKGLGGVFFMALTLVLVSFSCTGPIVGTVLIKSTSGEIWTPIVTMLAFSIAFSLPFTLLALFPSLLKKLPKSGGWLNTFKVVLGFVELALGLKFLQVADQTYHWGLLDREIYLAIWIVIFALLGFYLLGKLRFKFDSPVEHVSFFRLMLAIVDFAFVVYMIPGMWGAPLKGISGYLPPIQTQDFVIPSTDELQNMLPEAGSYTMQAAPTSDASGSGVDESEYYPVKYADNMKLSHNLKGFFTIKQAEAYAKHVNKPIFLDFTGVGCMNCREMESRVFSDQKILKLLREEYVICALYCDDKTELEEEDWITTDAGKVLKNMGKANSYYALKTYGVNAQPYYVLLGKEGKVLTEPRAYGLDIDEFVAFLEKGVAEYKKQ